MDPTPEYGREIIVLILRTVMMKLPKFSCASACAGKGAALMLAAVMSPVAYAGAASSDVSSSYLDNADFFTDMQIELSGLKPGTLDITNDIYNNDVDGDGTAFRQAKVEVTPLIIRQLNVYDGVGMLSQVMCKTKNRDGLLPIIGNEFTGKEGECSKVTKTLLRRAFTTLSAEDQSTAAQNRLNTIIDVTVYDEFGGLVWANPGAFETIVVDSDGTIHLRSEGLFTANDPNTAISDAFVDLLNVQLEPYGIVLPYGTTYADLIAFGFVNPKELGTQYCTVPTVEAIQRVLIQ